jgi:hypothetical protein
MFLSKKFNILDPETWDNATENALYWKGEPAIDDSTGKPITEKEMASYFKKVFGEYEKERPTLTNQEKAVYITDFFNKPINSSKKVFDIMDRDTWHNASDKQLVWQGVPLFKTDGNPMPETEAASFLDIVIRFIGRNKQLSEKNITAIITKTLNKTIQNGNVGPAFNEPKPLVPLDPRNPKTYRYAMGNQLVIDGLPIYRFGSVENWTIAKKPVTETDFVNWIKTNIRRQRFQNPEERQQYYCDYVQWYYGSNDLSVNVFGRFKFNDGMMELASHLSVEIKEKIGRIFSELLQSDPRAYRFQQELFDKHIEVDPLFFSKIAVAASFQAEQDLMADYYHECEFDTEAEALEYFNASEYLKKYPRLKEKIIKAALKKFR